MVGGVVVVFLLYILVVVKDVGICVVNGELEVPSWRFVTGDGWSLTVKLSGVTWASSMCVSVYSGWDCCTGLADLDLSAKDESLGAFDDKDIEELFSAYSLRVGIRDCRTELFRDDGKAFCR